MSEETKTSPFTQWQNDFLQHIMRVTDEEIERMAEVLVRAGVMEAPLPTDPRERALHLRKHRNTGPGKPIQEQRRRK